MGSSPTPSILRKNADRSVLLFAANLEPQIAYVKKVPNAVESVMKHIRFPHWGLTPDHKYVLRETNKSFLYILDHQVFHCQTLGLDPWTEYLESHFEAMSITFNKLEATRIKRLTLAITSQIALEMLHREMCDLLFGSYLVERDTLAPIYGKLNDVLLQLHGNYKDLSTRIIICPQTAEQSRQTFLTATNLDAFVEPKYLDCRIKEHYERVWEDSLNLSIEISK
jgi:hypothetical protein